MRRISQFCRKNGILNWRFIITYIIFRNSGSLGSRVCLLTNLGKILCSSKSQEIQMFCKQSCNLWFHTSLYMKLKNEQELSHWNSITTIFDTFKIQLMSFIVLPLDCICCYCYNVFLEENDNPEVCGINAYFVDCLSWQKYKQKYSSHADTFESVQHFGKCYCQMKFEDRLSMVVS